jgi:hypothetical protein
MYADPTYHPSPIVLTLLCVPIPIFAFTLPTDCLIIVVVETVDQIGLVQPHAFEAALISASPRGHEEVEKSEKKRAPHFEVLKSSNRSKDSTE